MRSLLVGFIILTVVFCAETIDKDGPERDNLSDCVKRCLRPLAKMERTYNYVFNNFEKVCDMLETGAECSVKCGKTDQQKYWQYTTFYRIHCVNYEEEIEDHIDCLKNVSKDIDDVCKDKCKHVDKVDKGMSKEAKLSRACKALECTTVCYFEEFVNDCPASKDFLIKLNLEQIREVSRTVHPESWNTMSHECKDVNDVEYMRAALLSVI